MVSIGDRLVVMGRPEPAYIEKIEYDSAKVTTVLHLDWKQFGKSRVYLHDEGKIWIKYHDIN